jgi:hypothetical protein
MANAARSLEVLSESSLHDDGLSSIIAYGAVVGSFCGPRQMTGQSDDRPIRFMSI